MGSSGSHLLDPNPTTKVAGSAPAAALHRADSDPVHAGDEEAMLHELRSGKKALASEKFESTVGEAAVRGPWCRSWCRYPDLLRYA